MTLRLIEFAGRTGQRCRARYVARSARPVRYFLSRHPPYAGMAELADAADSKSADRKVVGVRPPLPPLPVIASTSCLPAVWEVAPSGIPPPLARDAVSLLTCSPGRPTSSVALRSRTARPP